MTYASAINYQNKSKKESMLKEISMIDFAIIDLSEYLDTHPGDEDAVTYIKQYMSILCKLKEEYAALFGPLTLYDSRFSTNKNWGWAKMPLPWEGDAN